MRARLNHLDGIRAVAILTVVFCHASGAANAVPYAWWGRIAYQLKDGVAIFFVLSGYLLYRPFLRARRAGRPLGLSRYARHRVLRIVPAYWLALTALAVWPGLPGVFSGHWWVYYGFMQVYSLHTVALGLATAWSLGAEVGFYFLLPVYALLVARMTRNLPARRGMQVESVVLMLIGAGTLLLRAAADSNSVPFWSEFTVFGNALWFVLGMGLALVEVAAEDDGAPLARLRRWGSRAELCWGTAALVLVVNASRFTPVSPSHRTPLQQCAEFSLGGLFGLLVVAPAVLAPARSRPMRLLAWRPLAGIGLISYGIFLWHFMLDAKLMTLLLPRRLPWIAQTTTLFLLDLAAATVLAWVSWRLVEQPLMRRRDGLGSSARPAELSSVGGLDATGSPPGPVVAVSTHIP